MKTDTDPNGTYLSKKCCVTHHSVILAQAGIQGKNGFLIHLDPVS